MKPVHVHLTHNFHKLDSSDSAIKTIVEKTLVQILGKTWVQFGKKKTPLTGTLYIVHCRKKLFVLGPVELL